MSRGKYIFGLKFEEIFPKIVSFLQTDNQTKIAKFFEEMTPGSITNFKGKNIFPANRIIEFAEKTGLSVDYLLGRTENMKVNESPNESPNESQIVLRDPSGSPVYGRRLEDKHYISFRLLNKEGKLEAQKMQFLKVLALRDWLEPQLKGAPSEAFMTVMEGDSMAETISPGDILFCDGQKGNISDVALEDVIYVLSIEGSGPIVRRLQRLPNQMVKVISDNPRYDSFSISKDSDCNILGRVIWITRKT